MADTTVRADNPAGRLYCFLRELQNLPDGRTVNVGQNLASIFQCSPNDIVGIVTGMATLVPVIEEIADKLKAIDVDQHQVFLPSGSHLKQLVNVVPLGQMWSEYKGRYIRNEDLKALQFASITLSRSVPDKILPLDELEELREQVEEAYRFVQASTIEYPIKSVALDGLEAIRRAIHEYRLRGAEGLEQAVAQVMGSALINPALQPNAAPESEWGARFWKVVGRASDILTLGQVLAPLLAVAADRLLS